jgi:hypothetical protein
LKSIRDGFASADRADRSGVAADAPRPSDEDASVRVEQYKNDLLAVLTPDQIKQWRAMAGAPFKTPKFFSGPSWRLVLVPEVQKELGLSEDGAATLERSLTAIQREGYAERSRAFGSDLAGRDQADQRHQSQQIIDTVRASLTVTQWNRLQELILQQTGAESVAHHEVAKELGLNQEQRDRAREIITEYQRSRIEGRTLLVKPKELRARQQKEQADLLDVLTPDQKKMWEAMQGAKVDLPSLLRPRISPAGK